MTAQHTRDEDCTRFRGGCCIECGAAHGVPGTVGSPGSGPYPGTLAFIERFGPDEVYDASAYTDDDAMCACGGRAFHRDGCTELDETRDDAREGEATMAAARGATANGSLVEVEVGPNDEAVIWYDGLPDARPGSWTNVATGYLARRPDGRVEILCDVGWARLHPTLTEPSGALTPLGREVFAAAESALARRQAAPQRSGCSCRAVAADRAADLLARSERFRAAGNERVADRLLTESRAVGYVRDSLPAPERPGAATEGPSPTPGPNGREKGAESREARLERAVRLVLAAADNPTGPDFIALAPKTREQLEAALRD